MINQLLTYGTTYNPTIIVSTKTEHHNLHQGQIYCRSVVIDCIRSIMYLINWKLSVIFVSMKCVSGGGEHWPLISLINVIISSDNRRATLRRDGDSTIKACGKP